MFNLGASWQLFLPNIFSWVSKPGLKFDVKSEDGISWDVRMTWKRIVEMFNFLTGHSTFEPLRTETLKTLKTGILLPRVRGTMRECSGYKLAISMSR